MQDKNTQFHFIKKYFIYTLFYLLIFKEGSLLKAQKPQSQTIQPTKPKFGYFKQIHKAPIVLIASTHLSQIQYHPLDSYRVFRTAKDGSAEPIPFQIDEKDKYGD